MNICICVNFAYVYGISCVMARLCGLVDRIPIKMDFIHIGRDLKRARCYLVVTFKNNIVRTVHNMC